MYNLDPEKPDSIDDFTAAMLEKEGKEFSELEREIVDAPFVQVRAGPHSTGFFRWRAGTVGRRRRSVGFGWVQGFFVRTRVKHSPLLGWNSAAFVDHLA